jgi:hypothetical protein
VGPTYENSRLEASPFERDTAEVASSAARVSIAFTGVIVDHVNVVIQEYQAAAYNGPRA